MYQKLPFDQDETYPEVKYGTSPPSDEIKEVDSSLEAGDVDLGDGELCDTCSRHSFQRSTFECHSEEDTEESQEDLLPIGSFRRISQRKCALCRLIVRVLENEPGLMRRIENHSHGDVGCQLFWSESEAAQEIESPPKLRRLHVRVDFCDQISTHRSILAIEPISNLKAPEVLLGRIYDKSQVNLDLIQIWLRSCNEWHNGECKKSFRTGLPHPASQITFYAIDVIGMHLAKLSEDDQYCALSYVWGAPPHYRLTINNLAMLMAPNGLARVLDQIPQTIKDSIDLTRDLGIRYFWVDSICIIQDDESSMNAAIEQMHLVYSKAHLTIVAASGNAGSCGLPGYRKDSRETTQAVQRVGKLGLILGILPRYQWFLYHSPHAQRAWTWVLTF
jgi:hypothetical protein